MRSTADIGLGRQMHEQDARRPADCAGAMAAAADIVGEENLAVATPVLLPVARFDFECAGKHDEKLSPRGRVPVLVEALGHFRQHSALRRQYPRAVDDIPERVGRRIIDREPRQIATRHQALKQSGRVSSGALQIVRRMTLVYL
jgi:hypothetical protein